MTTQSITNPLPSFIGLDGAPLSAGYVYIGEPNQDPKLFPTTVYYDAALTIPASQPLRTSAGYIVRNGRPTTVWTDGGAHSLLVLDANSQQVVFVPQFLGVLPATLLPTHTVDRFSGNGAQVAFNLSVTPISENDTDVFVAGVYQQKNTYSLAANVLTFAVAPAAGVNNIEVNSAVLLDYASISATITSWVQSAMDWATKVVGSVAGGLFSAKEYAQGSQAATGGSALNWAQQIGADVTGAAAGSRSAKSWATDNLTPAGANLGGSAKDWAQSASKPDGVNESAKTSAAAAAGSRLAVDNRIYPGVYSAPPATRPDGTAIQNGDYYFNSTGNLLYVRNAGVWTQQTSASTADLANSSDIAKGSALVGHRGTTAQVSIDDRHRNLKLNKLKGALSDIITNGAGVASLAIFGDSVARHPIPDEMMYQLYRTYGWRGVFCSFRNAFGAPLYSTGNLSGGTNSGTATATSYTAWPAANTFNLLAAGNRVRFGSLPPLIHPFPYINRATLVYVKKPGGGTFKVQTWSPNDGVEYPVDEAGLTAVSTANATVALGTIQVNFATRAIGNEISALWVSGDVEIVGCLVEDTTAAGLIVSYMDSGGLDMDQSNTVVPAALSTLLTLLAPHLITWGMKDLNIAGKLVTQQALWDAAYTTDWLYITPYPDAGTPTEAGARINADIVIQHAISHGLDWYDLCIDVPTYAYGTALGWFADVTHLNTKAINVLGARFIRATGLLPGFRAGSFTDAANFRALAADALVLGGYDQATVNRQVRSQEISRNRGLHFPAGGNYRILSEAAITAVGVGDFTLACLVRVPTGAPSLLEFAGASGVNGNSTGGAFWFGATANSLTLNYRTTDNTANVILQSLPAGAAMWAKPGEVVMLACRRTTAPAAGNAPYQFFVNGVGFAVAGQAAVAASLLQDMAATWFKVGSLTQNLTQDLDMFGAALYRSALTDAALLAAYQKMDFPTGYEIFAPMSENRGNVTGRRGEKRSHIIFDNGTTWTNPEGPVFRRTVPAPGALTLRANDTVINDYTGDANRYVYTLPTPAQGDFVEVIGYGQGGFRIGQPASHQILEGAGTTIGTNASTAGVTGYIQSAARYDSCRLRCVIADTVTPSYIWVVERRSGCTFA